MVVRVCGPGATALSAGLACFVLAGAPAGHAQAPAPPAPAPQPRSITGFVPSYEIMRTVRAAGLQPLEPPLREGRTYVLRATDYRGILMHVVLDARTGAIRDVTRIVGPGGMVPPGGSGPYGPPPYGVPAAAGPYGQPAYEGDAGYRPPGAGFDGVYPDDAARARDPALTARAHAAPAYVAPSHALPLPRPRPVAPSPIAPSPVAASPTPGTPAKPAAGAAAAAPAPAAVETGKYVLDPPLND